MLMNSKQTGKISPTQLTHMLHHFFGKPLSTSLLRHIYLSDRFKNMPGIKELKTTATALGHSVPQLMEYIKH